METRPTIAAALAYLTIAPVHAIVLFGLDNSANRTDPGTGVPWDSVGRLSDAGGTIGGSAIYLGNGYVLTANHVGPFDLVTFDGTTFYSHDGAPPVQVAGNVDMKIIHLTTTPTVAAVTLYSGSSEGTGTATQVGWGVGRDSGTAVNATVVPWGDTTTSAKRWGLNASEKTVNITYGTGSYQALVTVLGATSATPAGLGDSEAATTVLDSGSGLFQFISGQWQLIGMATAVETSGTSTFGKDQPNNPNGEENYFVRIGAFATQINAIIPEPSSMLLSLAGGFLLVLRRRR